MCLPDKGSGVKTKQLWRRWEGGRSLLLPVLGRAWKREREKGQKERREQMSHGCQLSPLLFLEPATAAQCGLLPTPQQRAPTLSLSLAVASACARRHACCNPLPIGVFTETKRKRSLKMWGPACMY